MFFLSQPELLSFPPSHCSQPVLALFLIPASYLYLPLSSSLPIPAKPQQAGQQAGAGVEDSDKMQLLAALRSSESGPSEQSRLGRDGHMAGQDIGAPQEVNMHSPGSPFVNKQDLCSTENKWEKKNTWADDAFKGPEYLWICTVTLKLFWWH